MHQTKIDFVIPYVDPSDANWKNEKEKYYDSTLPDADAGECRYRDWGLLKYWFRSVCEHASWVNKIYLIVNEPVPDFLNLSNERLVIVKHRDFIPEEYLPTFSANVIEDNMHRIEGLSNTFVYFNDDVFLNKKVPENQFFVNGVPCYTYTQSLRDPSAKNKVCPATYKLIGNDLEIINRNFSRAFMSWKVLLSRRIVSGKYNTKTNIRNLLTFPLLKKYTLFYDGHFPCPFLKSTFFEVWKQEGQVLQKTSTHKFRHEEDVNQYLFRYWDLARGNFYPTMYDMGNYSINSQCLDACAADVVNGSHMFVCVNDTELCDDFELCKQKMIEAFQVRYPHKCEFEK